MCEFSDRYATTYLKYADVGMARKTVCKKTYRELSNNAFYALLL